MGYSNGGTGSVHFAKIFPETFSAAIPMGADFMEKLCPAVPTYMIHGSEDEFYTPAKLKRIVDGLKAKDCDIQLHFVEGANHGGACQMVGHLTVASIWLEMEAWKE